jgi:uncharacterized membrane protein
MSDNIRAFSFMLCALGVVAFVAELLLLFFLPAKVMSIFISATALVISVAVLGVNYRRERV